MNIIYYLLLGFGIVITLLVMVIILVITIKKSIENGTDPNDI
jgi:uncharacterized membrane protein YgaE (UPF0421/DUF939 family)